MKHYYVFFLFIIYSLCTSFPALSQKTQWVFTGTSQNSNDVFDGLNIKTDHDGRIYVSGGMLGDSMALGSATLKNTGKKVDNAYIARCNASGKIIWAQTLKGNGSQMIINHLEIDGAGYIYIAGNSVAGITLGKFSTSDGGLFMAKMDSNGHVIWLKRTAYNFGSGIRALYHGFCTDKKGNSYFSVLWRDTAVQIGNITVKGSATEMNSLVAEIDSAGNAEWAKPFGTAGIVYNQNLQIGVDAWGNVYVCEGIVNYVVIGGIKYVKKNNYYYASYLAKFGNKGDLLWSKLLNFDSGYGCNIAVDNGEYIYMTTGSYYGHTAIFDTDTLRAFTPPASPENGNQSITVKFDSGGKTVWAKQIQPINGGTSISESIFLDRNGDIYIEGRYNGSVKFGKYNYNFGINQGGSGFVAKYNNNGLEQGMYPVGYINPYIGGYNCPNIKSMAIAPDGATYFTGTFTKKAVYDAYTINSVPNNSSMTGKLSAFPSTMPDSMGNSYSCAAGYKFILYYNTGPDSVIWDFGDKTLGHGNAASHYYAKQGKYNVTATSYIRGQVKTFKQTISFASVSPFSFGKDTTISEGKALTLRTGYPTAKWSTGATGDSIIVTKAGTYWATISSGGCTASDTINIKTKGGISPESQTNGYAMQLIPNPASAYTVLKFNSPVSSDYVVSISDLTGKEVYRNNISAIPGTNGYNLDISGYKTGAYIITLENNGVSGFIRFLKN
jgi:hypothetical protein